MYNMNKTDLLNKMNATIILFVWWLVGLFSTKEILNHNFYFTHGKNKYSIFAFYSVVLNLNKYERSITYY